MLTGNSDEMFWVIKKKDMNIEGTLIGKGRETTGIGGKDRVKRDEYDQNILYTCMKML